MDYKSTLSLQKSIIELALILNDEFNVEIIIISNDKNIEEIKIEGTEGDIAQKHKILLNKNTWAISCSNSLCEDKGYSVKLGDFIFEIYGNKETSKEGIISCGGI